MLVRGEHHSTWISCNLPSMTVGGVNKRHDGEPIENTSEDCI